MTDRPDPSPPREPVTETKTVTRESFRDMLQATGIAVILPDGYGFVANGWDALFDALPARLSDVAASDPAAKLVTLETLTSALRHGYHTEQLLWKDGSPRTDIAKDLFDSIPAARATPVHPSTEPHPDAGDLDRNHYDWFMPDDPAAAVDDYLDDFEAKMREALADPFVHDMAHSVLPLIEAYRRLRPVHPSTEPPTYVPIWCHHGRQRHPWDPGGSCPPKAEPAATPAPVEAPPMPCVQTPDGCSCGWHTGSGTNSWPTHRLALQVAREQGEREYGSAPVEAPDLVERLATALQEQADHFETAAKRAREAEHWTQLARYEGISDGFRLAKSLVLKHGPTEAAHPALAPLRDSAVDRDRE